MRGYIWCPFSFFLLFLFWLSRRRCSLKIFLPFFPSFSSFLFWCCCGCVAVGCFGCRHAAYFLFHSKRTDDPQSCIIREERAPVPGTDDRFREKGKWARARAREFDEGCDVHSNRLLISITRRETQSIVEGCCWWSLHSIQQQKQQKKRSVSFRAIFKYSSAHLYLLCLCI